MAGPSNPQQPNVASDFAMLAERCIQRPFMTRSASPQARWRQSGRTSRATAPLTRAAAARRAYGTNAERAPWNSRVRFAAADGYRARPASVRPRTGAVSFRGRYRVLTELSDSPFQNS
jgi:hypothetical protein